jgi:hypothetical protein
MTLCYEHWTTPSTKQLAWYYRVCTITWRQPCWRLYCSTIQYGCRHVIIRYIPGEWNQLFCSPWPRLKTLQSEAKGIKTVSFFQDDRRVIKAHWYCIVIIRAPNEKKPFLTINGEWNGLMFSKYADKEVRLFSNIMNKLVSSANNSNVT